MLMLWIPESVPPAQVREEVVGSSLLERVVVGQGVVDEPEPGGHVVGEEHVYRVVAPGGMP